MSTDEFIYRCKSIVLNYLYTHIDITDGIQVESDDIYAVWVAKILQNNKALLSTNLPDGMYYEMTYNGDKKEIYMDAYKKFENRVFKIEGKNDDRKDKNSIFWFRLVHT